MGCSYCDWCRLTHREDNGSLFSSKEFVGSDDITVASLLAQEDISTVVGAPEVFISHSRQSDFLGALDALEWHFRDRPNVFVWIDIFSINQHNSMDWTYEWLTTTFRTAIQNIGHTVLILSPWDDALPLPLTRTWCIYELYCTCVAGNQFDLAFSEADHFLFLGAAEKRGLQEHLERLSESIHSRDSSCSNEVDRRRIVRIIEESVGFDGLDNMIWSQYAAFIDQAFDAELNMQSPKDCKRLTIVCLIISILYHTLVAALLVGGSKTANIYVLLTTSNVATPSIAISLSTLGILLSWNKFGVDSWRSTAFSYCLVILQLVVFVAQLDENYMTLLGYPSQLGLRTVISISDDFYHILIYALINQLIHFGVYFIVLICSVIHFTFAWRHQRETTSNRKGKPDDLSVWLIVQHFGRFALTNPSVFVAPWNAALCIWKPPSGSILAFAMLLIGIIWGSPSRYSRMARLRGWIPSRGNRLILLVRFLMERGSSLVTGCFSLLSTILSLLPQPQRTSF